MKNFTDLVNIVEAAKEDAAKFEKGNKTAGTRLRKKMLEVKKLALQVRSDVSTAKKEE